MQERGFLRQVSWRRKIESRMDADTSQLKYKRFSRWNFNYCLSSASNQINSCRNGCRYVSVNIWKNIPLEMWLCHLCWASNQIKLIAAGFWYFLFYSNGYIVVLWNLIGRAVLFKRDYKTNKKYCISSSRLKARLLSTADTSQLTY